MKVLHLIRESHVGDPEVFWSTISACAPTGSLTDAGWDRLYRVTSDQAKVTCKRCLDRVELLRKVAVLMLPQDDTSTAPKQAAGLASEKDHHVRAGSPLAQAPLSTTSQPHESEGSK